MQLADDPVQSGLADLRNPTKDRLVINARAVEIKHQMALNTATVKLLPFVGMPQYGQGPWTVAFISRSRAIDGTNGCRVKVSDREVEAKRAT